MLMDRRRGVHDQVVVDQTGVETLRDDLRDGQFPDSGPAVDVDDHSAI